MRRIVAIVAALLAGSCLAESGGVRIQISNVGTAAVAEVASVSDGGKLVRLVISNTVLLPVQIESANDAVQVYASTGFVGAVTVTNLTTPVVGMVIKSGLAANLAATTNTITIRATLEK